RHVFMSADPLMRPSPRHSRAPPFSLHCSSAHRDLPSSPTRRSSDLKGRGGDHSELGAQLALDICPRLGLKPEETVSVSSGFRPRSEEHTSELQSRFDLVCRLLLEKKKKNQNLHSARSITKMVDTVTH